MSDTKSSKIKKIILLLSFISLTFGYFSRINFGSVFIGLYLWDILLIFHIIITTYELRDKISRLFQKLPGYYKLLILFIFWSIIVTINAYRYLEVPTDLLISSLYLFRWTVYSIFGITLYLDIKNKTISSNYIENLILYEGVLISVIGFLQLFLLPDFTVLSKDLLWDPHKNRLAALYFDPNFTGIILVFTVGISFYKWFSNLKNNSKRNKRKNLLLLLAIILQLIAIVLTFSRGAWLALAVSIFVISIIKYRWVIPISLILIFMVYYAVPRVQTRISGVADPADSFYLRFNSWNETLNIAKTNPITGYGFNTLRYMRSNFGYIGYLEGLGDRSDSGSDSSLLLILANTGIVGLIMFVYSYLKLVLQALSSSGKNIFSLMFLGILLAFLVNAQFINSMFFPAAAVNFSVITALFLSQKSSRFFQSE